MSDHTGIEWTDATWNPLRGCSRVSEGCRHCYAETVAHRFSKPGQPYDGLTNSHGAWNGNIMLVDKVLDQPLRWQKPRRIFVNSMSDLFHEKVPFEFIDKVFAVMALAPRHTFQILTTRPARMLEYVSGMTGAEHVLNRVIRAGQAMKMPGGQHKPGGPTWPFANVWLGVSVENQAAHDERLPLLMRTPAEVRWISAEPLLGPINLGGIGRPQSRLERPGPRLDWVVVGGESGAGARPMHPAWVRSLRDQCINAKVQFLFKQWGEWAPNCLCATERAHPDMPRPEPGPLGCMFRCGKKAAGREIDSRTWDEYPATVEAATPRR